MNEYKCPVCGNVTYSSAPLLTVKCKECGCEYQGDMRMNPQYATRGVFDDGPSGKNRGLAGLLAILLGALGVHYFYMGKNTAGIICLVLTLFSCGIAATLLSIMGLIQGILMLTMSEEEFESRYIYNPSTFPF